MSLETSPQAPIGIVGTGSVAQALGRLLYRRGAAIVAVTSRTPSRGQEAAAFIGRTVEVLPCTEFARKVSRVLIATSDAEITPAAERLADAGLRHGVVLHTCGACGPGALAPLRAVGNACGVCHPLQTVADPQQGVDGLPGVAFGISGDGEARLWAEEIAAMLGGWTLAVDADSMAAYHAGAVIVSNSQPALIEGALQAWARAGIDRSTALAALGPLSRTSLENALRLGPEDALTGPVARGDAATVRAHVAALTSAPAHVDTLYRAFAKTLLVLARRRGLSEIQLQEVAGVLDAEAAT
jgi:predicted short-subunit dehydrogenase-like oxidoreductase (DUF2520 family)